VVEDEEPLQEIVRDALKEGGFNLTMVASGREAVAMIESGVVKYSALVADVNLKGSMKGWEIARLVRQIDPALSIKKSATRAWLRAKPRRTRVAGDHCASA